MVNVKNIEANWKLIENRALNTGVRADSVQMKEMRELFYMGAYTVFTIVCHVAPELSDDQAYSVLDSLKEEMEEFMRSLNMKAELRGVVQ